MENSNKMKKSSKFNLSRALKEENDIDYGKDKPGLFKYYIWGSISWIISYAYITLPIIIIAGFIFGTSFVQYVQGNSKPVWGMRTDDLPATKELVDGAKKITNDQKPNYKHFKVYVSGPEIHIEIGLNEKDVTNYDDAQSKIKQTYDQLLNTVPENIREKVRTSYSATAIVAGMEPDKTDTNLHAYKGKRKLEFTYYHK